MFREDFDGPELERSVWLPHYLPAWSSRAATAAAYEIRDSCLRLFIPPAHGLWMPADHPTPLRVSGPQTGNFSGPVGSTIGQQPLEGGSVVREEQETFWGFTPCFGRLEMRARAVLTPRSMVAWWMVGLEDEPSHCAKICVFEIFGNAVQPGSAAVAASSTRRTTWTACCSSTGWTPRAAAPRCAPCAAAPWAQAGGPRVKISPHAGPDPFR